MAMESLDPRNGGTCSNFMAKKFFSYVTGYVQLIFWGCSLLTVMFKPSSLGSIVEDEDTAAIIIAILFMLFSVIFAVLLLIGLHKNRRIYVQSYCIYLGVYLVMLAVSFVINIFLQPHRVGFRGFFSTIIVFFLHVLFLLVVRCYYLITYCVDSNMAANRTNFKV